MSKQTENIKQVVEKSEQACMDDGQKEINKTHGIGK